MPILLLFWSLACIDDGTSEVPDCVLDTPVPTPASASPGDTVVLATHPVTETWDTVVTVGGLRAELASVDRADCDDCDDCRDTGSCNACEPCDDCAEACGPCVETITLVVPLLGPGSWPIEVINRHGRSAAGWLEVTGAPDTGDTGDDDTGDTGAPDTGGAGGTDTGDTAASDTGDGG